MTSTQAMKARVLVLNKAWKPINVVGVERAFSLLYGGVAKALDEQYQMFDYESWEALGADLGEHDIIHTATKALRIPRILVLQVYDKFPLKSIRFSRRNIYSRDDYTCQYCGNEFSRVNLNLDHVIPRCQGGRTSWENIVASCLPCNEKKGGRTPVEANMRLLRKPRKPSLSDMNAKGGIPKYREWIPFLDPVDAAYWNTELISD